MSTVYTYDTRSRMRTVTTPAGTTVYDYYANDLIKRVSFANNTVAEYTYDDAGRLTDLLNRTVNGQTISRYQYTYDADGNRTPLADRDPYSSERVIHWGSDRNDDV